MAKFNKKQLLAEAEAQTKALKTIKKWLTYTIGISTLSVALTCFAFLGETTHIVIGVIGIILVLLSTSAALIINLGIKKGTKNIEQILCAAEGL